MYEYDTDNNIIEATVDSGNDVIDTIMSTVKFTDSMTVRHNDYLNAYSDYVRSIHNGSITDSSGYEFIEKQRSFIDYIS